jgi:hypothetical protein
MTTHRTIQRISQITNNPYSSVSHNTLRALQEIATKEAFEKLLSGNVQKIVRRNMQDVPDAATLRNCATAVQVH